MTGKTNDQVQHKHGDFVWYELMTGDVGAAQRFYGEMLGWTFEDSSFDDTAYQTFSGSGGQVGGFMAISNEMSQGGARPAWAGYIQVNNVNDAIEGIESFGGSVIFGPGEIPGVGTFAMVCDPQGAPFYVVDDRSGDQSKAFCAYEPQVGHCAWNELVTADPDAAKAWYGKLFGFVQTDSMDMGPVGEYCIMRNAGQDFDFGAVMKKPDEMSVSLWTYYFRVPDIDKAVDYAGANGAQVINGPMEIPGGDYVLNAIEPQGAMFALIGKRD